MKKAACALILLLATTAAHAEPTLFESIGGKARLHAAVDQFALIIESDDRINFTFASTDIGKFKQLLFDQLCELTGGPCKYGGRDMFKAHQKLNINNAQFNALAEDLYTAFDRVGVPYRLQNRVMALLAPMEHDVVKSHPVDAAGGTGPAH